MAFQPDIIVEKKSDSPDKDKSVHDARLLIPTLVDFFAKHPLINPETFIVDAAFDSAGLYKSLFADDTFGEWKHFSKAYILLNARVGLKIPTTPSMHTVFRVVPLILLFANEIRRDFQSSQRRDQT